MWLYYQFKSMLANIYNFYKQGRQEGTVNVGGRWMFVTMREEQHF